jgi:N-acyl-phosphatidylethanolamine-hydrolysing phospholipase D
MTQPLHLARFATTLGATCLSLAAFANPYFDATLPHHTAIGFRNPVLESAPRSLGELIRWRWGALVGDLPPAAQSPTPTMAADLPRIRAYQRSAPGSSAARSASPPAVTWIGHASTLVQAGGLNVLTDPIFSERAFPVQIAGPQRAQPPGVAVDDLPPIDVVIISHNHYDHLDRASVVALNARAQQDGSNTLFLVPLGQKPWFEDLGITHVVELDWWQKHTVRGVEFFLTPVQHWSARGVFDQNHTLWGGWSVFAADLHWYFGGDAGYSADFAETRRRFADRQTPQLGGGFDLALLPVGAYAPRWFMSTHHLDPEEAVQAHLDLQAKRSVAVHWGTFALTDEALDQPPKDLLPARAAKGLDDADFALFKIGETRSVPARMAPLIALSKPGQLAAATKSSAP